VLTFVVGLARQGGLALRGEEANEGQAEEADEEEEQREAEEACLGWPALRGARATRGQAALGGGGASAAAAADLGQQRAELVQLAARKLLLQVLLLLAAGVELGRLVLKLEWALVHLVHERVQRVVQPIALVVVEEERRRRRQRRTEPLLLGPQGCERAVVVVVLAAGLLRHSRLSRRHRRAVAGSKALADERGLEIVGRLVAQVDEGSVLPRARPYQRLLETLAGLVAALGGACARREEGRGPGARLLGHNNLVVVVVGLGLRLAAVWAGRLAWPAAQAQRLVLRALAGAEPKGLLLGAARLPAMRSAGHPAIGASRRLLPVLDEWRARAARAGRPRLVAGRQERGGGGRGRGRGGGGRLGGRLLAAILRLLGLACGGGLAAWLAGRFGFWLGVEVQVRVLVEAVALVCVAAEERVLSELRALVALEPRGRVGLAQIS